jgi:hypothetical protein
MEMMLHPVTSALVMDGKGGLGDAGGGERSRGRRGRGGRIKTRYARWAPCEAAAGTSLPHGRAELLSVLFCMRLRQVFVLRLQRRPCNRAVWNTCYNEAGVC